MQRPVYVEHSTWWNSESWIPHLISYWRSRDITSISNWQYQIFWERGHWRWRCCQSVYSWNSDSKNSINSFDIHPTMPETTDNWYITFWAEKRKESLLIGHHLMQTINPLDLSRPCIITGSLSLTLDCTEVGLSSSSPFTATQQTTQSYQFVSAAVCWCVFITSNQSLESYNVRYSLGLKKIF